MRHSLVFELSIAVFPQEDRLGKSYDFHLIRDIQGESFYRNNKTIEVVLKKTFFKIDLNS